MLDMYVIQHTRIYIWAWLKISQEGLRRFWSRFPLTRVPFWHRFFEPQPYTPHMYTEIQRYRDTDSQNTYIYIYIHITDPIYRLSFFEYTAGVYPEGNVNISYHGTTPNSMGESV